MYFRIYNLSILKQIAIAWQSQQFNFDMPRQNRTKNHLHRPGIEPGSPAWQASILPLDHRCERIGARDRNSKLFLPIYSLLRPHLLDIIWPVKRTLKCN